MASGQGRAQLNTGLLQRSIQRSPIAATRLSQVGPTTAAAATGFGNATDEGTGFGSGSNHALPKSRHQDHLAQIRGIGQAAEHHSRALAELIRQPLGSTLQAAALHTVQAGH